MSHCSMRASVPTGCGTAASPTSSPAAIRHTPKAESSRMQRVIMSM